MIEIIKGAGVIFACVALTVWMSLSPRALAVFNTIFGLAAFVGFAWLMGLIFH